MIGNAPKSSLTGVPGWETEDEQALLLQMAQAVPDGGQIVEIGGDMGMSASIFCKGAAKSVSIVTVDPFDGALLETHLANLAEAGFKGRSKQIRGMSEVAGRQWEEPIDLLFVDGDHAHEGVKRDIDAWVKHILVGGHVVFHDCACATNRLPHEMHFYVTRAVSEWFFTTKGKWRILTTVNTTMVFERVK